MSNELNTNQAGQGKRARQTGKGLYGNDTLITCNRL